MASKQSKEQPAYRARLIEDEDRVVVLRVPEHVVRSAYGTLSNASRRGATLNAQRKVVEAFVAECEKQYGKHEGEPVTWKALKIEKILSVTNPRR